MQLDAQALTHSLPANRLSSPLACGLGALVLALLVVPQMSGAKTIRTSYVSFEIPDKWDCALETTEWVCRTGSVTPGVDSREAIIIFTAKEVGPQDSLPLYAEHLKLQRTIPSRTGAPMQSQVIKVEQKNIAGQPWVDGMHLSSEVPNYYTRYLATTKDRIGIVVTFSAHKLHYTKYTGDFFRAVESLRVVAVRSNPVGGGGGGGQGGPGGGGGLLGPGSSSYMDVDSGELPPEENGGGSGFGSMASKLIGFALLLLAVGGYLVIKQQQKPKKKAKSKTKRPPDA